MELFFFGDCRYCFYENLVFCGGVLVFCYCYFFFVVFSRKGSLGRDEDFGVVEEREEYYGFFERGFVV